MTPSKIRTSQVCFTCALSFDLVSTMYACSSAGRAVFTLNIRPGSCEIENLRIRGTVEKTCVQQSKTKKENSKSNGHIHCLYSHSIRLDFEIIPS